MFSLASFQDFFSNHTDWIITKPIRVILILIVAFVLSRLVRSATRKLAERIARIKGRSCRETWRRPTRVRAVCPYAFICPQPLTSLPKKAGVSGGSGPPVQSRISCPACGRTDCSRASGARREDLQSVEPKSTEPQGVSAVEVPESTRQRVPGSFIGGPHHLVIVQGPPAGLTSR